MLRSMTGYGRKEVTDFGLHLTLEIRSLNNRYLDIQIKAPRSFTILEPRVKKAIQERFARGRFDIYITCNGGQEKTASLSVNQPLAEQYINMLREIKQRHNLIGDVDIALIANFPDIIAVRDNQEDPAILWRSLSVCLDDALDELDRMRASEGSALVLDIKCRLGAIERLCAEIRAKAPATVELARKRMTDALAKAMQEQPDPVRIAQEIAVLADRTDVTEELTRLDSHLRQFQIMLDEQTKEGVGRKLDFLIQEMGREVNTIASKAMDAQISLDVVHVKAELEKIREQVQNLE